MPKKKKETKEVIETSSMSIVDDLMRNDRELRSGKSTPRSKVKKRADGFDYVEEGYMRSELSKNFPSWSWLPAGNNPVMMIGSEWVIVTGNLMVNDNGNQRNMFMPGAARIQYAKGKPHTIENLVDLDNNVASANTYAFKRAVNRLCNIADDVYRKQDLDLTDQQIDKLKNLLKEFNVSEDIKRIIRGHVASGRINNITFDNEYSQLENDLTQHNKET